MDEKKVRLLLDRIAELKSLILSGRGNAKDLTKMLELNERILTALYREEEIRVTKVPEVETPDPSGFFLTQARDLEPFLCFVN